MPVDRCICHEISFSEIKKIVEERDFTTVQELRAEKICSTNCRLCEPYVRKLLETGRVSFQPIIKVK
ncbi:MAG: (2Fe-2S)-binding protein [Balneolaceae bacterium]|nr:(2Fe-2S)-binding protein [Balneolaceae bacterium]